MLKRKLDRCTDSKLIFIEIIEKIKAKLSPKESNYLIKINYTIMTTSKIPLEFKTICKVIIYINIKTYIVESNLNIY